MDPAELRKHLLQSISIELVQSAYGDAPGNEIESGKFGSPESSAALVANTFGPFLDKPKLLPKLPKTASCGWPANSVQLEEIVRFPWAGGRHPCLDVLICLGDAVIGVESKRYEPYRTKGSIDLSDAYWRPVWGNNMMGYEQVRDRLREGSLAYEHLDATQLTKHAFGLRTLVNRQGDSHGKRPLLYYLFAEPKYWPDGRSIPQAHTEKHRAEIKDFAEHVINNEVEFIWLSYAELLDAWCSVADRFISNHAKAVIERFTP